MEFYSEEDISFFDSVRFSFVRVEVRDFILTITLNRPEKRNAFTPVMAQEITYALAFAGYSDAVRCVVITAEGPAFCAGADLNAFHNPSSDQTNATLPAIRQDVRLGDAFAQVYKPIIAQVEGPVLAGGFLIICGCTFVISTPEASFSLPEINRGIWPMQVMASLTSILPKRKILEMAISGNAYSATEALGFGLISQIVDKENITCVVNQLSAEIVEKAPLAIRKGLEAINSLSGIPEQERHAFLKAKLEELLNTEDAREGVAAFKDKRKPVWKGK